MQKKLKICSKNAKPLVHILLIIFCIFVKEELIPNTIHFYNYFIIKYPDSSEINPKKFKYTL